MRVSLEHDLRPALPALHAKGARTDRLRIVRHLIDIRVLGQNVRRQHRERRSGLVEERGHEGRPTLLEMDADGKRIDLVDRGD